MKRRKKENVFTYERKNKTKTMHDKIFIRKKENVKKFIRKKEKK
jgi:hypothetical protein